MLLWSERPVPIYLLPIPLAWSVIGFWAAISLGITEDFGLLAAGLIGSLLIILRDRHALHPTSLASHRGFESK
jgi:hypothetical protein